MLGPVSVEPAEISKERLQRWLDQYRSEEIAEFSAIAVGISNTSFAASCVSGHRYVLRRLGTQALASVRAEALIQQALVRQGLSSPTYLALREGGFVGHDGSDAFTIAHHVPGEHPERLSLQLVRSFGETLTAIHGALDPGLIDLPYNRGQWLNRDNITLELARCAPEERSALQVVFERALPLLDSELPRAIIHGELATNNVFASDDRVTTIFDFENAEYAPRLLDVAYTYVSMAYDEQLDPRELLLALRTGYDSAASPPLTAREWALFTQAVEYAAVAASAWCHARGLSGYGNRFLHTGTHPAVRAATGTGN
jgi:Ser/Thr protein kinase RdoA (MazF antagonist)